MPLELSDHDPLQRAAVHWGLAVENIELLHETVFRGNTRAMSEYLHGHKLGGRPYKDVEELQRAYQEAVVRTPGTIEAEVALAVLVNMRTAGEYSVALASALPARDRGMDILRSRAFEDSILAMDSVARALQIGPKGPFRSLDGLTGLRRAEAERV